MAPLDQSSPSDAEIDRRATWRAFWVCVVVAAITILDPSKVNVALPSIEDALGASSIQLQIIVSGYVLPFGWSWFLQGLPLDIIALILAWRILLTPSETERCLPLSTLRRCRPHFS